MKQDVLNPLTWNRDQWTDALLGAVLTFLAIAEVLFVIIVFQ